MTSSATPAPPATEPTEPTLPTEPFTRYLFGQGSWGPVWDATRTVCSGGADTIINLAFGKLLDLAVDTVKHYRSDFAHDLRWLIANLSPTSPSFGFCFDDCGTYTYPLDDETVAAAFEGFRDNAYRVTLRAQYASYRCDPDTHDLLIQCPPDATDADFAAARDQAMRDTPATWHLDFQPVRIGGRAVA